MSGAFTTVPYSEEQRNLSRGFWRQRTGLIAPAIVVLFGILLAIGTATMEVPDAATPPGPQVFPALIAVGCLVIGVILALDVLRHPEPERVAWVNPAEPEQALESHLVSEIEETPDPELQVRTKSNIRALIATLVVLVIFIAALQPVGWLLAGAFLFWGISRSLGSRKPGGDVPLALIVSSIVQLAFSAGLGLNLPPGILEGVL